MRTELTLDPEQLTADSFGTAATAGRRGTVLGEQCTCCTQCTCRGCPTLRRHLRRRHLRGQLQRHLRGHLQHLRLCLQQPP